jgi:hypothetical protein
MRLKSSPTDTGRKTVVPPTSAAASARNLTLSLKRVQTAFYRKFISLDSDPRVNFIRGIRGLGDSLTVAAAHFVNAQASIHVGDWRGAKEHLQRGFAEIAVDSRGSDKVLERLAILKRRAQSQQRKSGLRVTKKGAVPRA